MNRQTIVSALAKRSIRIEELCPRGRLSDARWRECERLKDAEEPFLRLVINRYGHRETAQLLKESNAIAAKAAKAREREAKRAHKRAQAQCVAFCW